MCHSCAGKLVIYLGQHRKGLFFLLLLCSENISSGRCCRGILPIENRSVRAGTERWNAFRTRCIDVHRIGRRSLGYWSCAERPQHGRVYRYTPIRAILLTALFYEGYFPEVPWPCHKSSFSCLSLSIEKSRVSAVCSA